MALVSSLYRLGPSPTWWDQDEAARRLRGRIRYIVLVHGKDEAERRVRAWRPRHADELALCGRFLLEIGAIRPGHAASSA